MGPVSLRKDTQKGGIEAYVHYTVIFRCNSLCLWTDLSDQWKSDSWMFCTSFFSCLPLETPWWGHGDKDVLEQPFPDQQNDNQNSNEGLNPFAILLLQVKVVSWVNALLHPSPVPRHPTLDGHISGSRTQSKYLEIIDTHGGGGLERERKPNLSSRSVCCCSAASWWWRLTRS